MLKMERNIRFFFFFFFFLELTILIFNVNITKRMNSIVDLTFRISYVG